MDEASARQIALSLPETTEEPHFGKTSFRVHGKIFATVPPEGSHLHVFVDEPEAEACVAEDPVAFELLHWGQRLAGLRIQLGLSAPDRVRELLEEAWRRKAPKSLIADFDRRRLA